MKLGVTIGNSFANLATFNQEDIPVMVTDALSEYDWDCFTPLKQTIDDTYAFVGAPVNSLLLSNKKIFVAENFLNNINNKNFLHIDSNERKWTSTELLALFIKKLRIDAEIFSSNDIEDYTFVIPSYFSKEEKQEFISAIELLDITPVKFIEDYKAAIYGYQLIPQTSKKNILIYDLGKTHFHISIVNVLNDQVKLIYTSPKYDIGGQTIDELLLALIRQNLSSIEDKKINATYLQSRAERIKVSLSTPYTAVARDILIANETPLEIIISKSEYENLIHPIVTETIDLIKIGISEVGLKTSDIDFVAMVGGSSKINYIQKNIRDTFNHDSCQIYCQEPRKVLSKGSVIWAYKAENQIDILTEEDQTQLRDTISINVTDSISEEVIRQEYFHKGDPLPSQSSNTFSNFFPEQKKLLLEVKKENEKGDVLSTLGIIHIILPQIRTFYQFDLIAKIDKEEELTFSAINKVDLTPLSLKFEKGITNIPPKIKIKRKQVRVIPKQQNKDRLNFNDNKNPKNVRPKIKVKVRNKSIINDISIKNKVVLPKSTIPPSLNQETFDTSKKSIIQEIIINNIQ